MNEFSWGVVAGVVASPFAWLGVKWCYDKLQQLLSN
jgi:hypothetical protein